MLCCLNDDDFTYRVYSTALFSSVYFRSQQKNILFEPQLNNWKVSYAEIGVVSIALSFNNVEMFLGDVNEVVVDVDLDCFVFPVFISDTNTEMQIIVLLCVV